MKKLLQGLSLSFVLAISLLAPVALVSAQEESHGEEGELTTAPVESTPFDDVQAVTIWSLAAIAAGGLLLGVLYLFKRQIGAFPEHPVWTAPISIMRARDLPSEGDSHGHDDAHDSHAAAH